MEKNLNLISMHKMVMIIAALLCTWRLKEMSWRWLIFCLVKGQILQLKIVIEKRLYSWLKNVIM